MTSRVAMAMNGVAAGFGPARPVMGAAAKAAAAARPAGDSLALNLPAPDEALVARALASGATVRFRNDQGSEATLSVARLAEGKFRLTLDGAPVEVRVASGLPAKEALARIADYLSQLPPTMRGGVSRFEISTKPGGDAAATTYNGHRVVFWEGMTYLRPSTFFHEMGHVNAKRLYGHTDPSDAWDRAQATDGEHITDYSKTSDNEGFAEMIEANWLARRGEGTYTVAELRKQFPERMKIVDAVAEGRPVETEDSDYWRIFGLQVPKPVTIWNDIDGAELLENGKKWLQGAGVRLARLNPFAA